MAQIPRVGVAALILRNDGGQLAFLMGCRKGSHGASTWAPPGGHLEYGESYFACAERETLEETGLRVHAKKLVAVTNDLIPAPEAVKHYVTLYVLCEADDPSAEPEIKEPNKCEGWKFIAWTHVRACASHRSGTSSTGPELPLFLPILNLLDNYPELETTLQE